MKSLNTATSIHVKKCMLKRNKFVFKQPLPAVNTAKIRSPRAIFEENEIDLVDSVSHDQSKADENIVTQIADSPKEKKKV